MAPIENLPSNVILQHLLREYNINAKRLVPTPAGLDNSVYFVYLHHTDPTPSFVFKMIETRRAEDILRSLQISSILPDNVSQLKYIRTTTCFLLSKLIDKCAFVMSFVSGQHLGLETAHESSQLATFIANFHRPSHRRSMLVALQHAELLFEQIHLYWTNSVQHGLANFFPYRKAFYDANMYLCFDPAMRRLTRAHMEAFPATAGLTHGDLHNDNLIKTLDGRFSLIDFDATKEDGFQLMDLLQAMARWPVTGTLDDIAFFLQTYLTALRGGVQPGGDELYFAMCSIVHWLRIFTLKSMLSLDFYTFEIRKFTAPWSRLYASQTLERLQACFEECDAHVRTLDAAGMANGTRLPRRESGASTDCTGVTDVSGEGSTPEEGSDS